MYTCLKLNRKYICQVITYLVIIYVDYNICVKKILNIVTNS